MKGIDWYENQLERDDLTPDVRERYERIADQMAEQRTQEEDSVKARKRAEAARFEAVKALLVAGDSNVVDLYGFEEFGRDYNTHTSKNAFGYTVWHVMSTVARADQPNSWSFGSEIEARRQLHSLIYDRMYYKYVRCGHVDSVREI